MNPRLEAEGIHRWFSGLHALDDAALAVSPGEVAGVIGPNGSGKTTLVNVITGLLKPTSGTVKIDGVDVTGWSPQKIARAGASRTFQNIRLFAELTSIENVEVALAYGNKRIRRNRRAEARGFLEELKIEWAERRLAGTLSYGTQRRLEIARALAAGPRYLILDEPAAGMNEAESDQLVELLSAVQARYDLGLIIIDHDLRVMMRFCDTITVLNEGHVIAHGLPKEVRTNPTVIAAYLGESKDAEIHKPKGDMSHARQN